MKTPISVTIITLNEEKNLKKTLVALQGWADEIIVVDSGSTDKTQEIAKSFKAKFLVNTWQGYGQQKNFAQSQTSNPWVLNIDADEVLTDQIKNEIDQNLQNADREQVSGYSIARKSFYVGRWIKYGGWYPSRVVRLAKKTSSKWTESPVHEELVVQGTVKKLQSPLDHYTFHSIKDQVLTNVRYATQGGEALSLRGKKANLFLLVFKPIGKFVETYFLKLGFLDGTRGFIISVNAAHSMFLKYASLYEKAWKQ